MASKFSAVANQVSSNRYRSRSPRGDEDCFPNDGNDILSADAYTIIKCIVLCEDHRINHLKQMVHLATRHGIDVGKFINKVAKDSSHQLFTKAEAMGFVEKVRAKWGLVAEDVAMAPGNGDANDKDSQDSVRQKQAKIG